MTATSLFDQAGHIAQIYKLFLEEPASRKGGARHRLKKLIQEAAGWWHANFLSLRSAKVLETGEKETYFQLQNHHRIIFRCRLQKVDRALSFVRNKAQEGYGRPWCIAHVMFLLQNISSASASIARLVLYIATQVSLLQCLHGDSSSCLVLTSRFRLSPVRSIALQPAVSLAGIMVCCHARNCSNISHKLVGNERIKSFFPR